MELAAAQFFASRSAQPEVMDAATMSTRDYDRCLNDLAQVNRLTQTHAPTLKWLAQQVKLHRLEREPLVIVDVGYGQGDLLRAIAAWAAKEGLDVQLHGVDLSQRCAAEARWQTQVSLPITFHIADVFDFELDERPHFIVSSQFTHHLDDRQVKRFLRWAARTASHGWFIADLERSRVAFHAFPVLCAVAGWHPVVRRDGQVSIARSWTAHEWRELVADAGVKAEVSRALPFRLTIASSVPVPQ
ncbi:MAG: methyltransferase domain-containing protein [Myxococcaceae bacterium]